MNVVQLMSPMVSKEWDSVTPKKKAQTSSGGWLQYKSLLLLFNDSTEDVSQPKNVQLNQRFSQKCFLETKQKETMRPCKHTTRLQVWMRRFCSDLWLLPLNCKREENVFFVENVMKEKKDFFQTLIIAFIYLFRIKAIIFNVSSHAAIRQKALD